MSSNRTFYLALLFILIGFFTSCREEKTCASAISELMEKGCSPKQLSRAMSVPEKIIKNPGKYHFSEADSIFLFSLLRTYNSTGELPDNLYGLHNRHQRNQMVEVIENFRQEEIKSNEVFAKNLCEQIIDIQYECLNDFIESEVNSFKSLRFIWKSQDEINQALGESLPKYVNEIKVAKIYNDSCASYFNYISRFRDNGVRRYITKSIPQKNLNTIEIDVRGFIPEYQFEKSSSHVTYQILSTIERAQDILLAPINWILELLPTWVMITISLLLLIMFILSIYTGQVQIGVIDLILFIISIILIFWSDPYSEVRDSMRNQIQVYYENKIGDELNHLNTETNKYYDGIHKSIKAHNSASSLHKSVVVPTSIEKNDGRDDRTDYEKKHEGSDRTWSQSDGEVVPEASSSQRDEVSISEGN